MDEEIYYTIALTRMTGFNQAMALQLYQSLGGGKAVYEQRQNLAIGMRLCVGQLLRWSSSRRIALRL